MMNHQHNPYPFVIRLRGLPWNTNANEIRNFLQDCQIEQIKFLTNSQGRPTGECFVIVKSNEDINIAKSCDKNIIGTRYIEVFQSNFDTMCDIMKINNNNMNDASNNNNWQEPVVRLRGLPYNSSNSDVVKFFNGLDIAQNGVYISSGKPAGEAFVAFVNMDNALRALEFNRMNMGHRYIEIFKSSFAEARGTIINDAELATSQNANGSQEQRNRTENNTDLNPRNSYNQVNRYNDINEYKGSPPSRTDAYEPYVPNRDNYLMDNNNNNNNNNNNKPASLKRSLLTSFAIKMRGVPFGAGKKEIHEFFDPTVPIDVEQENTIRGRPPMWIAEFGSREEAVEAMKCHKKYMGQRYIELLPQYDDFERSKMSRK